MIAISLYQPYYLSLSSYNKQNHQVWSAYQEVGILHFLGELLAYRNYTTSRLQNHNYTVLKEHS